mgnify:FL=1
MASPPSVGQSRSTREPRLEFNALPSWAHREVVYWYPEWQMIRDICAGERAVKDQGKLYLPQLEGMDDGEFQSYLERATFYPFTGRTASAMSGTIFRRKEQYENFPTGQLDKLADFTKDKQPFRIFAIYVAEEVIKMGRFGVLLDLPAVQTTIPRPYVVGYTAENIIDWEYGEIDGRNELVRVVLREARHVKDTANLTTNPGVTANASTIILPQYRQLRLTSTSADREYIQEVFFTDNSTHAADLSKALDPRFLIQTIVPTNRGKTLDYIPFRIIGAAANTPTVEKPPLQDIARINVSHFRSYANLEHGRLFTGFPIYYVEAPVGGGETDAEFELGASKVWVTPPGAKPGLLEMNGQGLKFLVDALDQKESHAAALGGRLMGIRSNASVESDNLLKISERNEQSILLKVTLSLDEAFTAVLRWWLSFQDVTKEVAAKASVEFDKDFLFDGLGAREFRAIQSMYMDGVLPIEIVYAALRKSEIIPDWMTEAEFTRLLDKKSSFPNNTNFDARKEGFADAKSRDLAGQHDSQITSDETIAADLQANTNDRLDVQVEADAAKAQVAAKAAKEAAKLAPKPVPGQPGQPGASKPGNVQPKKV